MPGIECRCVICRFEKGGGKIIKKKLSSIEEVGWFDMNSSAFGRYGSYFKEQMMTSSNGNIFRVTGPLCGEFTSYRWIPLTKTSDAELTNGWVYNRNTGDWRRRRAHYDVTVMHFKIRPPPTQVHASNLVNEKSTLIQVIVWCRHKFITSFTGYSHVWNMTPTSSVFQLLLASIYDNMR